MKNIRARLALLAYRGVGTLSRPLVPFYLSWRAAHGKEERKRCRERLGRATKPRPDGALIWLHAASVGETMALIPIIERIVAMQINILLTTGTIASSKLVAERFQERVIHQYVPLDLAAVMRRFLNYWKPDLSIVCESEIWPARIQELARRRIPQILLNAHLSDRSYQSWKKRAGLSGMIFSKFDEVICQDETDALRYRDLGAQRVAVSGNLKADVVLPGKSEEIKRYSAAIGLRPSWAAISTHEGEEMMAAEVHRILRKRHPDLLTIIVPRHIERTESIAANLRKFNYSFVRKSHDEVPDDGTDILLGDTIGDMGLYLNLTEIAFVGKSLSAEGGHNPIEPALSGAAILSGPNIQNFKHTYQELMNNDAVQMVDDKTMLAGYIHHLLERPDVRFRMIESGRQTVSKMSGARERTFEVLEPFLHPLRLSAELKAGD